MDSNLSEEKLNTEDSTDTKKKSGMFKTVFLRVLIILGETLLLAVIFLYFVMNVCVNGPSERVKELFVLSVKESSAGGFLADIYLSKEEIAAIQLANSVEDTDEITDVSIVSINAVSENNVVIDENGEEVITYIVSSSYDSNVYVENGIEFHEIKGATFTGVMAVVADPSRVFVGTPRDYYDGSAGLSVPTIADRYGSILAINGAFFVDEGGVGNGGTPIGFVFSNGKQLYGGSDTVFNMMGFTEEGVLMCGRMTGAQAVGYGIRDGLTCNPFLIINGEVMNVNGSGGGLNPRTALGQRADGAVLLLVIDGRQATSLGASMSDVADVMYSFGAVNAGNLDGGGSSVLYYNGEIMNVVMSIYGARGVPDAVCVLPE